MKQYYLVVDKLGIVDFTFGLALGNVFPNHSSEGNIKILDF